MEAKGLVAQLSGSEPLGTPSEPQTFEAKKAYCVFTCAKNRDTASLSKSSEPQKP